MRIAASRLLQCIAFLSLATTLVTASAEPRYEHGISFFHDLKYPADFTHFDYVNPDAPKGGVLVQSTQTDFNTLTRIADNLVAAPGLNLLYDSLVSRRAEEMSSWQMDLRFPMTNAPSLFACIQRLGGTTVCRSLPGM